MNKKFSTLLATLLVAGGMSSASAAVTSPSTSTPITKIETTKAYQLYGGLDQLLVMTKNANGQYNVEFLPADQVNDLASSLWTISYVTNPVGGPDFTLVNKATGCPLSVNLKDLTVTPDDIKVGGNISSWKWYPAVTKSTGFTYNDNMALKSYFTTDSVAYLTYSGNTVKAAKAHANDLASIGGQLTLAPYSAAAYVLSAKELNTKIGTDPEGQSFKLSATPELKIGTNSSLGNILYKNVT